MLELLYGICQTDSAGHRDPDPGLRQIPLHDLDLGTIGGLPRVMDIGQCNDAYSAIQIALALADAFDCGVNDYP